MKPVNLAEAIEKYMSQSGVNYGDSVGYLLDTLWAMAEDEKEDDAS